jgi:hypothetical protein
LGREAVISPPFEEISFKGVPFRTTVGVAPKFGVPVILIRVPCTLALVMAALGGGVPGAGASEVPEQDMPNRARPANVNQVFILGSPSPSSDSLQGHGRF